VGLYIQHFYQISVKKSFSFGDPMPLLLYRWGEIWHGGGCQISPHRCSVSPLRGEKPENRSLGNLNIMLTGCR